MSVVKVKYNINFRKALGTLKEKRLTKIVNQNLARKTAKLSRDHIQSGKVRPKLSENNPRRKNAKPLFDTGALAKSVKGGPQGIRSIEYGKYHRQEGGYTAWGIFEVPQREFIPHFKEDGKIAIRGTKSDVSKIYKDFETKFVKLLSKRIRKRRWKRAN